jgi:hypothetical protein
MKRKSQEIDYCEAITAMRTMLALNNTQARELENADIVGFEVIHPSSLEKPGLKRTTR